MLGGDTSSRLEGCAADEVHSISKHGASTLYGNPRASFGGVLGGTADWRPAGVPGAESARTSSFSKSSDGRAEGGLILEFPASAASAPVA